MNVSLEKKIAVGLGAVLILLLGIGFRSPIEHDRPHKSLKSGQRKPIRCRETIEHLLHLMEDSRRQAAARPAYR